MPALHIAPAGYTPPARVGDVIDLYLLDAKNTLQSRSFEDRRHILNDFAAGFGAVGLADAKPYHVQLWLNAHPQWQSGWTRRRCIAGIQAAFNWAVKLGLIAANPFRGISCPPGERGQPIELVEFQNMLRHSPAPFRRFLVALRYSGARPGELAAATWSDFDEANACIELRRHKTAKKTGRSRRIILHPIVLALIRWLRAGRPMSALIFVNSKGGGWTRPAIAWHIAQLRSCGAIRSQTTLYCLRHAWACQAIVKGVDLPTVAECMGHARITSTMHYLHMSRETAHLREAVSKVFRT